MKINEEQITKMMKSLDLTREEAIELIEDDMEVDKMSVKECTSDMSEEQKKAAKAATITTGEKKKSSTPVKRERQKDEVKVEIISVIAQNLSRCTFGDDLNGVEDISIVKPEKEITFTVNDEEYSITLTKHRKKA
jgi:predicted DNA-binding transcriptional regulator YafY